MEPPHWLFESKHNLFDSNGELIPPYESSRSFAPLPVDDEDQQDAAFDSGASTYSAADPPLLLISTYGSEQGTHPGRGADARSQSMHSVYTRHSVYMADDVINSLQYRDEVLLGNLPERYSKGSVKAKVTWFGVLCLAGIGMFVEAFVIITTGQIKTIWHAEYPECWDSEKAQHCPNNIQCCGLFVNTPINNDNTCAATLEPPGFCQGEGLNTYPKALLCNARVISSVSYSEFAGIMAGMLIFGMVCDMIGRKNAGTLTSIIMIVGISGMTLFDSSNTSTLFIAFSTFFALFGLGVGGEYPLTASGAAEYHVVNTEDALLDDLDQHHRRVLLEAAKTVRRGETIALVFAMQGIGAVLGSMLLLVMIYISNQTRIDCFKPSNNSTGNNPDALSGIWRGFYLIGLLFVATLLLYRWLILEEGSDHAKIEKRKRIREARLGPPSTYRWKILRFYAPRLLGTGGNWFVWGKFTRSKLLIAALVTPELERKTRRSAAAVDASHFVSFTVRHFFLWAEALLWPDLCCHQSAR
jgi:MFS family permease